MISAQSMRHLLSPVLDEANTKPRCLTCDSRVESAVWTFDMLERRQTAVFRCHGRELALSFSASELAADPRLFPREVFPPPPKHQPSRFRTRSR